MSVTAHCAPGSFAAPGAQTRTRAPTSDRERTSRSRTATSHRRLHPNTRNLQENAVLAAKVRSRGQRAMWAIGATSWPSRRARSTPWGSAPTAVSSPPAATATDSSRSGRGPSTESPQKPLHFARKQITTVTHDAILFWDLPPTPHENHPIDTSSNQRKLHHSTGKPTPENETDRPGDRRRQMTPIVGP